VGVGRSALTTIRFRSFAGAGLAQFAYTLAVCAGLVLLTQAPVTSDREALTDADGASCSATPDRSRDRQWTDDVNLTDPDSCDDEDDGDDDGDDDAPGGSGHALSADHRTPANSGDTLHLVRAHVAPRLFHPLDAHSLRGPPAQSQDSNDADVDDDDDDDDADATQCGPSAVATRRQPHVSATVLSFRAASIDSGLSLRAPPVR
jgi:hypothetical protein